MTGMTPGIRYLVTKGSDDGTFDAGDHIRLETNGSLSCWEAGGWIDAADVPEATAGMECEPDLAWKAARRERFLKALAELEAHP